MNKRRASNKTWNIEALMTFEEVAAELQITPQRVHQIEKKAIRKLAEHLIAKGYGPEDVDSI